MLLRSSSNPALSSWFQQQNPKGLSSPEPDFIHRNLRSPAISFHSSCSLNDPSTNIARASSESDLIGLSLPKRRSSLSSVNSFLSSVAVEEDMEAEEIESRGLLFSSSGLDGNERCGVEDMVDGTGGSGGGGKICGGDDSNCDYHGSDGTDVYYQNMIDANPNNSLILGNYAKYLKEVRGDLIRAEEYCSRAILANPSDGNALSMFADLIWETQMDASRAQTYFDQAVQASPDDCYVMASYARFLWDAEEDDEEMAAPNFFQETSHQFPIAGWC